MKYLKYFTQFIFVIFFFSIFKLLGPRTSSVIGGKLFEFIGPLFKSKNIIEKNIRIVFPNKNSNEVSNIKKLMWNNYGRVFAEYMFIKDFRAEKLASNIKVQGQEILNEIKKNNQSVVFISGHFANFELMAMHLEKTGIEVAAIYRPLNNIFVNKIMESIRKNYICKNQIKKGLGGVKKLLDLKKKNFSTALMIDQRVSEGIESDFFNKKALTTTIPAQLVKKFGIPVVPIHIERINDINFKITISKPVHFSSETSLKEITDRLNIILEKMLIINPSQWIWSHNRWK
ncbi:lysophospholipid acyltransferase family protein [Candidatus Pelagibacter sp.]|nr:lysophospholipid acyltransferase family protein [Candidatus Pelagibacter sp.]